MSLNKFSVPNGGEKKDCNYLLVKKDEYDIFCIITYCIHTRKIPELLIC